MPTRSHSQRGSPSCVQGSGPYDDARLQVVLAPYCCGNPPPHPAQSLSVAAASKQAKGSKVDEGNVVVNCINRVDPGTHVCTVNMQVKRRPGRIPVQRLLG